MREQKQERCSKENKMTEWLRKKYKIDKNINCKTCANDQLMGTCIECGFKHDLSKSHANVEIMFCFMYEPQGKTE